jgi:hypothetical protein
MTAMRGADAEVAGGRGAPREERPEIRPIRDEYAPDEGHDDVGLDHTHPGSVRPLHGACPARTCPCSRPGRSVGTPLILIEGHAEPAYSSEPLHLPDGTMTNRVGTLDIQEN